MSEYAIQIPDSLLATIQQVAKQKRISVNEFFLTAVRNSLVTIPSTQKHKPSNPQQFSEEDHLLSTVQPLENEELSERWANYFATARKAPEEFMMDMIDEPPQPRIF
jgi:hypothetical protein